MSLHGKRNTDGVEVQFNMWRPIGDAVQGTSHVKMNIPCQDKVYSINRGNGLAASLADGAGSASLSHFGAEAASMVASEFLVENFERLFNEEDGIAVKREIVDVVLDKIDELCEENQCERRELASTLLAVAIRDDSFILVHLGDGVIGYLKNDELKVASAPDNGEFANETVFTTSVNVLSSLKLIKGKLGEITGFVLMSDGPETSLYDKRERRVANGIKNVMLSCSLLDEESAKQVITDSLNGTIRTRTTDDCSLMLVVDKERVTNNLLQSSEYRKKICGIRSDRGKARMDFYTELLEYIVEPKNIDQISKHFHIDKRVAKKRMDTLVRYGLIQLDNGKYKGLILFS